MNPHALGYPRRCSFPLVAGALLFTLVPVAGAQSGQVDQVNVFGSSKSAAFIATPPNVWQQQVRAGMSGQLEGFQLFLGGDDGDVLDVAIRVGDAWNTTPVVWSGSHVKQGPQTVLDTPFFDVSAANIQLGAGASFVIEFAGLPPQAVVYGSGGPPACYPEGLFVNGPTCIGNCQLQIGFRTWMRAPPPGSTFCVSTPNQTFAPASIWATGSNSISAGDLTLAAGPMPDNLSLIYYGTQETQLPFGGGFRCVAGITARLPAGVPNCGMQVHDFDFNARPPGLVFPGSTLYFQAWFRDFTSPGLFDLSDGYEITFTP